MMKATSAEVFVDVCTQRDYVDSRGARPSLNLHALTRNLKHLMAYARWARVPTLSCIDSRRPKDVAGRVIAECVLGTAGQQKPSYTLLPDRVLIDTDNSPSVALDVLGRYQQAILAKNHRDPFTNPKFDRLLTEMPSQRFVLFGVSLEVTIRLLSLGLMLRHRNITVVTDACGYWDADEADMTLRQLRAKNCDLVCTRDFLQQRIVKRLSGKVRLRASRFVA
ncbi:MAG: isochorismatase family protein [Phycisphaerae bacterium]|nr:isochorismatase family protein [Phycisphaerae bacterium]